MEQHYKFNQSNFNENGFNTKNGSFFLEIIREWERDFHDRFSPFFSNCLFANASTMALLKNCLITEPDNDLGMELINGEINLDINLELGKHSKRETIYALGSLNDEDEPLFFVRDDDMVDGMLILKYVPDSDEDEINPILPVGIEKIKSRLVR